MKKTLIIILLTFILGISNVNAAAEYSVTAGPRNEAGKEPCEYPIISDECSKKDNPYHVGVGQVFTIKGNGNTYSGYCIDPDEPTPNGGITYVEGDLNEISEHLEALKYICAKTEGNNDLRIAMLKAYSVNSGLVGQVDENSNTIKAYKKLKDGGTVFNTNYAGFDKAKGIFDTALTKKGATTSADTINLEEKNGKLVLTTTVPGIITIDEADSYETYVNGIKTKSPYTVENSSKTKKTFTIELKRDDCTSDIDYDAKVTFSYKKSDLTGSSSSSEYSIGYYKKKSNPTSYQRLISCQKNGVDENPDCVGDNCAKTKNIKVHCTAENCKKPEFIDGSGICKADGTTVVTVKEEPNTLDYNGQKCISELSDATKPILGNNTNKYCKIYCSENYTLTLPGPDAKTTGDKNVFINAGSYFTIDDTNMKDETTITCYGKMDLDAYELTLRNARGLVVTAYNNLSKAKAEKVAYQNSSMGEQYCNLNGSYRELYFDGDEIKEKTTQLTFGNLTSCPSASSKDSEISSLTTALNEAITQAQNTMNSAKTEWDQCLGWNFGVLNEVLKAESCSSEIDFVYQFDECDAKVVKDGEPTIEFKGEKKITGTNPDLYTGICDVNGNLSKCNKKEAGAAYTYINKQQTVTQKYKFDNEFTVHFETGKINCDAQTGDEYSDVYKGFPVSIEASQAQYKYEYVYTGIGHDFDAMSAGKCSMGRFDSLIKDKNNHGCYYDVNSCGDCDVYCEGPTGKECDVPLCDGECQVACVGGGCILDFNGGFLATYRTMSLNDPFPNTVAMLTSEPSKLLAVASTKDYTYKTNWTTEKGKESTEKIKAIGEGIYNDEAQYSIKLTPTVISEIRKYNAIQEENGKGYLNSNIKCIDGTNDNYGQCISLFVHETNEKWKFKINNDLGNGKVIVNGVDTQYDTEIVEIEGVKVPFIVYPGASNAFVGPAWK